MKVISVFFLVIFSLPLSAQQMEKKYDANSANLPDWAQLMYSENPDEGKVMDLYRAHYKNHEFKKNKHTQYYKRWTRNLSRTSSPILNRLPSASSNQWESIGPWDFDKDAASRSYAPGAAHVYTIEQSVSNPDVLYAGTATAGAWKSIDKGANWTLLTGDLQLSLVYAIEIDFSDPVIAYISGNGTMYKTMDGGVNWTATIDTFFTSLSHNIRDIKLNPQNNQKLYVATDQGLYISNDAGLSFNQALNGDIEEIEFHPNSTDTMYFIRQGNNNTEFYRSDDGGATFTQYTTGWPNPAPGDEQLRTEIAVTPADPDKIVALATGSANGGSGLYGIYISYDKGVNWVFRCCGPQPAGVPSTSNINMMGWQDTGLDDGGQYYYDLALAVNPTNANIIHVGGVQHWISTDDGFNFSCPAKWSHPHKKEYVHADIHDINYFGNDLWFACDGGVFYSSTAGDTINKRMFGIAGTDFWGFGAGFKDGDVMLGGTYHNGTLLKDNNTYINDWLCTDGGDGIRGFVNFGNPRIAYSDYGGKILSGDRTIPISTFTLNKKPNASYIIGESSQLEFDPRCYNWVYSGEDTTLWLSKNNGASFEAIHHFNAKVTSIEVAWSNPNVIYVATWPGWWDDKKIYRTGDAGATWTDITPNATLQNGTRWRPFDITVSSDDENTLWTARCTQSGGYSFADGHKVFKSTNGGQNWSNLSTPTLDGDKPTNIEHQRGSDGGVYLGTRTTVFYRNNSMTDWVIYDNNLPKKTLSTQLVPYYREGLLFNGTNRSTYQVDLYENTPPSAQIAADRLEINCSNDTVRFVDHSAVRLSSAAWNWSFPGGNPNSSTVENPIVVYSSAGSYDVTLTVTDNFGSDTQTLANFITYVDSVSEVANNTNYAQDFESGMFPPQSWDMPTAGYYWENILVDSGAFCLPSIVAYANHFNINQPGEETYLITNKVAIGNNGSPNYLLYDHAYSGYGSGYDDGFRIDFSTDCGQTWDSIYGAYGTDLQTVNNVPLSWYPTNCSDWVRDTINLSLLGYDGDTIMVRFAAINDYGNNFYLDNINIAGQTFLSVNELSSDFITNIYPNPTTGLFNIVTTAKELDIEIYSTLGNLVYKKQLYKGSHQIDLSINAKGVYHVRLANTNRNEYRKLIIH